LIAGEDVAGGRPLPGIDFEGIRDPLTVRGLVIKAKDEYLKQK
jgi:hypothetical protein